MIEVAVHEVVRYPRTPQSGQSPVVLLKEQAGDRMLPLRLSRSEGEALSMLLTESSIPRPMTHDLIARLLEAVDAKVEKVTVTDLHDDIYYATVWVGHNGRLHQVDARPSDALILAQTVRAPIFVESTALEQADMTVTVLLRQQEVLPFEGKAPIHRREADASHSEPERSEGEESGLSDAYTRDSSAFGLRMTEQGDQPDKRSVGTFQQKTPPSPRGHIFIGSLLEFRRDPLGFLTDLSRQYGDVARFRVGPWSYHLVSHPEYVKHVLQDNNQNYRKGRIARILDSITGQSLLVSEGDFWRRQRRLAQPAFHRQRLTALASVMAETVAPLLEQWRTYAEREQPINVWLEMQKFALALVSRTLFNTDLREASDAIGHSATVMVKHLNYRFTHPFTLPLSVPTTRHRQFHQAARRVDEVVYGIINERRRTGQDAGDLLSMLMQARDEETGEGMSAQELRNEVLTFLFAGYETTASALIWTWYLISQHPEVESRLRAELATVLDGRVPTCEDLRQLTYTRMVLEESMRVYPPGWGFERKALNEDEIGGYHIPAGSLIFLCPYVTHRHPSFWQNPEQFDPDRFTPEQSVGRPRYTYFPFGGGPRQCIGNEFAMMECQLLVAMAMQRYQLHLIPEYPVEPDAMAATLRTRHEMHMMLHQA